MRYRRGLWSTYVVVPSLALMKMVGQRFAPAPSGSGSQEASPRTKPIKPHQALRTLSAHCYRRPPPDRSGPRKSQRESAILAGGRASQNANTAARLGCPADYELGRYRCRKVERHSRADRSARSETSPVGDGTSSSRHCAAHARPRRDQSWAGLAPRRSQPEQFKYWRARRRRRPRSASRKEPTSPNAWYDELQQQSHLDSTYGEYESCSDDGTVTIGEVTPATSPRGFLILRLTRRKRRRDEESARKTRSEVTGHGARRCPTTRPAARSSARPERGEPLKPSSPRS